MQLTPNLDGMTATEVIKQMQKTQAGMPSVIHLEMPKVTVYFVGQYTSAGDMEVCGVFNDESLAVAACRDETYFVAPLVMNEVSSHETETWPGAYYPIVRPD